VVGAAVVVVVVVVVVVAITTGATATTQMVTMRITPARVTMMMIKRNAFDW
jgi:hypothetical protein